MSLVTTQNLSKSYEPVEIFSGLTLSIPRGARIAIVGANGIGKTTLLKIIAGEEKPSGGVIHWARNLRIGYLPQESVFESDETLWESCLAPFSELMEMQQQLHQMEHALTQSPDDEGLLTAYGELQTRFEQRGGYTYEQRINVVLSGLGFSEGDYPTPLVHLSGGQRTRALLARLLLENPDLLILDEPTNHLDIEAVEWLEGYLRDWEGAALIVSHDRYFVDRVCDHIWEMSGGTIEVYRGNYSHYLTQRQERWRLRVARFEAEKERLLKDLDYVKRNIAGQNVAQAKGRLRRISRQVQALEQLGVAALEGKSWAQLSGEVSTSTSVMGVDEAYYRIKALRNPLEKPPQLKMHLKSQQRSGNIILRTEKLVVGYPGNPLFRAPDLELRRLECAALIGPNGCGKTTFLKTMLGEIPPLEGELRLGASLEIGYFAQAHEDLNPDHTLVEEIESVAPHMLVAEIRSYLARYLFRKDDVFKKVGVLSGGERGRLALAKLALSKANLLLLDEPTNHLDIPAQEVLQNVLADFDGTIILVSHDRYLIDALATQIWAVDKAAKALRVFEGTYSEYRQAREGMTAREGDEAADEAVRREAYRAQQRARNRALAEARRRQQRIAEIEEQISALEARLDALSAQLADPPEDPSEVHKLGNEYVELEHSLNRLLQEWERLHEEESAAEMG